MGNPWNGTVQRKVDGVIVDITPIPYGVARRVIEAEAEGDAKRLEMMAEAVAKCCRVDGEPLDVEAIPTMMIGKLFSLAAGLEASAENFTAPAATT